MTLFTNITKELKAIMRDEGVLLFFLFLPVAYPLLYSWIYNNEVVHDVPVVLVDDSHSTLSREFARRCNASPNIDMAYRCKNIQEAREIMARGDAYGIIYFPNDFDKKIGRGEQSVVSIYCDMSYMLTYKAIYQTVSIISMDMGSKLQTMMLGNKTSREDQISTHPLVYEEVAMFNVTGGYGNFVLPCVLVLIIQQALLLGVGMLAGTERENRYRNYTKTYPGQNIIRHACSMLAAKSFAYLSIFSVMLAWITLIVPRLFGYVSMVHGDDMLRFMTPYLLSCVFFAITISELVRYRESVMVVVVFSSIVLLFMAGVSWPLNSIPGSWQGVSHIFPSTFCIRGFIRMSSMGARLDDVIEEYHALWVLTTIYAFTALFVMWRRVKASELSYTESTCAVKE